VKPSARELFYPEVHVGGFAHVDGTIAFYLQVNALLDSAGTVLDVGCGRGEYADDPVKTRLDLRILRGKCHRVLGIDPDPASRINPFVDEFRHIASPGWPVSADSVDLCLVDNVVEHVAQPDLFFAECQRVTRVGGVVCIRTPNALGYASVASRLIPNGTHAAVLRRVQAGRHAVDVFATHYRCNTPWRLRRTLERHGFRPCVYGYGPEPGYLDFSRLAYGLGAVWSAVAPRSLQSTLFAFARRMN
jgi:2-polyprenyl-3-methyl-5-hydroxy-6-metoxy-1,4-benzoquinol methylase